MSNKTFLLTIQTPRKTFLSKQVYSFTVRTEYGYMGLLANHSPLIAKLKEGNFEALYEVDGKNEKIRGEIKQGVLFFDKNEAIVLTNTIELTEDKDFNLFETTKTNNEG